MDMIASSAVILGRMHPPLGSAFCMAKVIMMAPVTPIHCKGALKGDVAVPHQKERIPGVLSRVILFLCAAGSRPGVPLTSHSLLLAKEIKDEEPCDKRATEAHDTPTMLAPRGLVGSAIRHSFNAVKTPHMGREGVHTPKLDTAVPAIRGERGSHTSS